jgi:diamine N-acetyltransferase
MEKVSALPLKGERITIRTMVREDLDEMQRWPPFTDPLLIAVDIPKRSRVENDIWFWNRINDPTRRLYAIEDEHGRFIGSVSLREIKGRESARLGITIGADYVGQSYGTDAIRTFLAYYFEELGFATLYLDVSATNIRAIRCYKKCGFKYFSSHYRLAGGDARLTFLKEERYRPLRRFFKRKQGCNLALFYDMKIERQDWIRLKPAGPEPPPRP